jgi:hypothetical protein
VCDVDWQLAGGHDATSDTITLADFDPTAVDRENAHRWEDEAGRVDGWLMAHGVRWDVLRWIPRVVHRLVGKGQVFGTTAGLVGWQQQLVQRQPPPNTRACVEGREVWLDAVEEALAGQPWQARRLAKYRAVAAKIAAACPREGGAITRNGCTYPELAAAAKCDKGHLTSIVRWFEAAGLLFVVVPGKHMPMLPVPREESPAEAHARKVHQAALEERARARQQLGLDAPVVDLAEVRDALGPAPKRTAQGTPVIPIAQVYQLRVPHAPETPVLPAAAWGKRIPDELTERRQRRARRLARAPQAKDAKPGRKAALAGAAENSDPSAVGQERESYIFASGVVEERAATPHSYPGTAGVRKGSNRTGTPGGRPMRAAQRLLGGPQKSCPVSPSTLPLVLRTVRPGWLAARIARYVLAGWSDAQLVLLIAHGCGQYETCPPVHSAEAFIVAALRKASPDVPFRTADDWRAVRAAAAAAERETAAAATERRMLVDRFRQAAIDGCPRCDVDGWTRLDGAGADVRCDHRADQVPVDVDDAPAVDRLVPLSQDDAAAAIADHLAELARTADLRRTLVDRATADRAAREAPSGTGYRPKRHRLDPVINRADLDRPGWFTRKRGPRA